MALEAIFAMKMKFPSIAISLIKAEPKILLERDHLGQSIFPLAVESGFHIIVEAIMKNITKEVFFESLRLFPLKSPLLHCLSKNASLDFNLFQKIIPDYLSPNHLDPNGNSVLHWLLTNFEKETKLRTQLIHFCISNGANPNLTNKKGRTPIYSAVKRNVKLGISFAISWNKHYGEKKNLPRFNVNKINIHEGSQTPVHLAASYPSLTILSELISDTYFNPLIFDSALRLPSQLIPGNYLTSTKLLSKLEKKRYIYQIGLSNDLLSENCYDIGREDTMEDFVSQKYGPQNLPRDSVSPTKDSFIATPYASCSKRKFISDIMNHNKNFKEKMSKGSALFGKKRSSKKIEFVGGDKNLKTINLPLKSPEKAPNRSPGNSASLKSRVFRDKILPIHPRKMPMSVLDRSSKILASQNFTSSFIRDTSEHFQICGSVGNFSNTNKKPLANLILTNQTKNADIKSRSMITNSFDSERPDSVLSGRNISLAEILSNNLLKLDKCLKKYNSLISLNLDKSSFKESLLKQIYISIDKVTFLASSLEEPELAEDLEKLKHPLASCLNQLRTGVLATIKCNHFVITIRRVMFLFIRPFISLKVFSFFIMVHLNEIESRLKKIIQPKKISFVCSKEENLSVKRNLFEIVLECRDIRAQVNSKSIQTALMDTFTKEGSTTKFTYSIQKSSSIRAKNRPSWNQVSSFLNGSRPYSVEKQLKNTRSFDPKGSLGKLQAGSNLMNFGLLEDSRKSEAHQLPANNLLESSLSPSTLAARANLFQPSLLSSFSQSQAPFRASQNEECLKNSADLSLEEDKLLFKKHLSGKTSFRNYEDNNCNDSQVSRSSRNSQESRVSKSPRRSIDSQTEEGKHEKPKNSLEKNRLFGDKECPKIKKISLLMNTDRKKPALQSKRKLYYTSNIVIK